MAMQNVFTNGTQSLMIDGKHTLIPINEDYSVVGQILSYNAEYAKITFKKVWSKGEEIFYAEARYQGKTGIPLATEVNVGSFAVFHRVGVKNVNYSSSQPAFQLDDISAGDKASFVAFFFPAEEET